MAAEGRRRVREVVVGAPGDDGGRTIPCDLVVLAGFQAPSTNLLAMTGAELAFDEAAQAFLPTHLPPNVHAAGAVAGARSLEGAIAQGRLAGLEAGMALGLAAPDADERIERLRAEAAAERDPVVLPPEVGAGHGKQFACLCMDVTNKELKTAVTEGFDSMELLKRYTTITMGPCQGKACMMASQRLCSRATGSSFVADAPDDRPAAVDPGGARDARGMAPEPAQGDDDPRPARRRRGDVHVGGRLAPAAPLHVAGGRGRGGSDARRRDRREHARASSASRDRRP